MISCNTVQREWRIILSIFFFSDLMLQIFLLYDNSDHKWSSKNRSSVSVFIKVIHLYSRDTNPLIIDEQYEHTM